MNRAILLSCLFFLSCQSAPSPASPVDKYIEKFEKEVGAEVHYPVVIVSDVPNLAGLCTATTKKFHPRKSVMIDRKFWKKAEPYEREILVYHELGHCSLGIGHVDEKLPNGRPESIMNRNPWIPRGWYMLHRKHYLRDLQKRAR